eukprot:TRINITY_DN3425_c0_g1_i1.p1 TRINITY_DN3425_c0_g1~~TRINITY_DN3425_c0_g1_i1.p1  ORF type:complete len:216 (+),score=22.78 TRINITY_DN3425_c0_g1_i1:835-1482(+)
MVKRDRDAVALAVDYFRAVFPYPIRSDDVPVPDPRRLNSLRSHALDAYHPAFSAATLSDELMAKAKLTASAVACMDVDEVRTKMLPELPNKDTMVESLASVPVKMWSNAPDMPFVEAFAWGTCVFLYVALCHRRFNPTGLLWQPTRNPGHALLFDHFLRLEQTEHPMASWTEPSCLRRIPVDLRGGGGEQEPPRPIESAAAVRERMRAAAAAEKE